MITITADEQYQIKGLCVECVFVAAKCAEDNVEECPYFAKESAMCEANSNVLLGDRWQDTTKIPEYDNHYLVYYDSGNMSVLFFWATTWEDAIKPLDNGDYIKAWMPLPNPPHLSLNIVSVNKGG